MVVKSERKSEHGSGAKAYLIGYNVFQAIGWMYTLFLAVTFMINRKSIEGTWNHVHIPLKFFQTLQAIEILHIIIGLVKSPLATTVIQISSRLFVLWAILFPVPEIVNNVSFIMLLSAWCVAEFTRYLFYATSIVKSTPYFLIWCRYTLFLVLYPVGVTGEVLTILAAVPYMKQSQLFTYLLPNAANISFYFPYLLYGILVTYIPGFPVMYSYMLTQRKKTLGPQKDKAK